MEDAPAARDGPVREVSMDAPCPACGGRPLVLRSIPLDLPYFGEALQSAVLCPSCGFRHADVVIAGRREPMRVSLEVTPDRLSARVVRSASGTVRIPELGAAIEPGPRAEAFVSNAEGVLRRFLDIVKGQVALAGGAPTASLRTVRRRIEGMLDGREPFTLVLEDPTGNSDILHADAVRTTLTAEEAAELKAYDFVLEVPDRPASGDG